MTDILDNLDALPKEKREIVSLYFGKPGVEPMTIDDIAKKKGMDPDEVRRIKEAAISQLRRAGNK